MDTEGKQLLGKIHQGVSHGASLLHLLGLAVGILDPFQPLHLVTQQQLICALQEALQGHLLHTLLTLPKHAVLPASGWDAGLMLQTLQQVVYVAIVQVHTHIVEHLVLEEDHVRSQGGELGHAHNVFWVLHLVQSDCHHQVPALLSYLDAFMDHCILVAKVPSKT